MPLLFQPIVVRADSGDYLSLVGFVMFLAVNLIVGGGHRGGNVK